MAISHKIIADSINPFGVRLTTVEVHVPLHVWVHILTHRCLSRNAQSYRAIPTEKLLAQPEYVPSRWMKTGKGMTPPCEVSEHEAKNLDSAWRAAASCAWIWAHDSAKLGGSKETINRILSPFRLVKGIVTGDESAWRSVFSLRCAPDTQWETRELMEGIRDEMVDLGAKGAHIHLPYINEGELFTYGKDKCMKISAARCARVSYLTHDGERDVEKDIALYDRLVKEKHMSPLEHPATFNQEDVDTGNFDPTWLQLRKAVEHGYV